MVGIVEFLAGIVDGGLLVLLALVVAAVPWAFVVLGVGRRDADEAAAARLGTALAAAAFALAACQGVRLAMTAVLLGADLGSGAGALFAATTQARAGAARLLLALALGGAALRLRGSTVPVARWALAGALAAAVLVAGGWLTHATSRLESPGVLMALTVLHQASTGTWVGGVLLLALERGAGDGASFSRAVGRFGRLAIPAVALSATTGVPLAVAYVGSWQGLVGSGPGSLLLAKLLLVGLALALGGRTFLAARSHGRERTRNPGASPATGGPRDGAFVAAEALLVVGAMFTAAALASQPPAVDTVETQASLAEVATTFAPKWPTLRTPTVAAKLAATADPFAVVGWERTPTAYAWSNFSHNVAGLVVLPMAVLMLLAPRLPRARHWPLGLVLLAGFVFLRSCASDGIWPFGPTSLLSGDAEGFQHRLAAALALALGLVEWRARTADAPDRRALVFPVLAAAGGILLVTHAHTAFEGKASYLVQVTHVAMGALAIALAAARLLEVGVGGRLGRRAGAAAGLAMLLVSLVLLFYREANILVVDGAVAEVARRAGGDPDR